jgi:hypothetical protein
MFTINAPLFGGALVNGLNQVKLFASREQAEAYLAGYVADNPEGKDLFVSQAYLVTEDY